MPTRGRVVPGPREAVPPPPSRTPTRYSSVCRVPTDRFYGGHRAPTCEFQRNQRATTDPCCTPVWTEGTERSPVPLAPTFVPHPSHPFFTDMRTPSPQQPVYPLARNRHPGSSHQPTRMASYRSWDESMRSANPESLHVDPYPRSPGISRVAAASEAPLPRYQDCVPTAQQRTMESQELRSIVAGTELLPQMPLLQGTHQTAKERGRTTLECFFKKQTTDTTPEVLDFLKEYKGRELELCDALNMALKDPKRGTSVNTATNPSTLCTPKPRREGIPQPYRGFAPAKLGEQVLWSYETPYRIHSCGATGANSTLNSGISGKVTRDSVSEPVQASRSPCRPTTEWRNFGVPQQPRAPGNLQGRSYKCSRSPNKGCSDEEILSPYLRYVSSEFSGYVEKPATQPTACLPASPAPLLRMLTPAVPEELLAR